MEFNKPLLSSNDLPNYDDLYNNNKQIDGNERNSFIKKVYLIVYLQLMFTIGICSLFIYNKHIIQFMNSSGGVALLVTSIIFQIFLMIILVCTNLHKKYPINYIILLIYTMFFSITLASLGSYYSTNTLLIASGSTALITLGLTLFAFQTKYDFTGYGPYLLSFLLTIIFMGILSLFITSQFYNILYSSIGSLLFSFYIVYDTQLIIGGKHKYQYDSDEHVFAAISLYLDIINLFLYLLQGFNNK